MIEKSQNLYYRLLYGFLKQNNICEVFINELIIFRNTSSLYEYITKEFISIKDSDFSNAISMAFPYAETADGGYYWLEISNRWRNYLIAYELSAKTTQNADMKSIW